MFIWWPIPPSGPESTEAEFHDDLPFNMNIQAATCRVSQ